MLAKKDAARKFAMAASPGASRAAFPRITPVQFAALQQFPLDALAYTADTADPTTYAPAAQSTQWAAVLARRCAVGCPATSAPRAA